jgi:hypothetical protein
VLNWTISRNYKEYWNSTKISVTMGMHLIRGGNVQRPLISGPIDHFAASHEFASGARSLGGGNKESKA